ncbi:hypothetical protein [Rubricoccus marinus]|nr:hypothetical protein [Rubricoccus marinus]
MTTSLFTDPDFLDGAIASRLLLKAVGGSVTTFAVAAGEGGD